MTTKWSAAAKTVGSARSVNNLSRPIGNEKAPSGADSNPFRYCGEYLDLETGTYYLRARYYDPALGRFTQADTHWNTANMIYGDSPQTINHRQDALGLTSYTHVPQITAVAQSGNLYVYCINSPVRLVDPFGNSALVATSSYVAVVSTGAANAWNLVGWIMLSAVTIVACGFAVDYAKHKSSTANTYESSAAGAISTPVSPMPPDDDQNRNWEKANEKYLEKQLNKQGTDPHEIKKEYLGKKSPIKQYDLYVDKNTGQLGIFEKSTGQLVAITDYFIK